MKLAFIADTIVPGASGVGDYSRTLAAELEKFGIETKLFTLDRFEIGGRVKAIAGGHARLAEAVESFNPDWVSIQFVPYAFHSKGLVSAVSLPWLRLRGRVGCHVMFHEIWIGAAKGSSLRHKLVGWIQKRGIKQVLRRFAPEVIHTSNALYEAMLRRVGVDARVLPLFGSIPVRAKGPDPYVSLLCKSNRDWSREEVWVFAFFGTIQPHFNAERMFEIVIKAANTQERHVLIASLGRCAGIELKFRAWEERWKHQIQFHVIGEKPADELSAWLGATDFALVTTPYNIIDKSSSAVAFVEHGVPTLSTDPGSPVGGIDVDLHGSAPRFWLAEEFFSKRLYLSEKRSSRGNLLPRVARQFIDDLNATKSRPIGSTTAFVSKER